MLTAIKDFARTHIVGTVIGALVAGMSTGATVLWSLYEARVTRVEEMKVAEFQGLILETKKFQELLSAFTEEVGTVGTVDIEKRKELSASLVRLYSGLDAFTVNLAPNQEPAVKKLQSSVNEVKKRIQLTERKQDLQTLGAALVVLFRDMKAAQPVLEQAVGRPFAEAT